jgi:ribosomal protein S18 acetylase RimI-like enzyme
MPVDVVHIRPPRLKDAPALATAYEEAWRNAYQGIIPHLSLERMIARRGLRWWETALRKRTPLLVLDFGGEAAGYVTYGRSRLRTQFQGEIFELYLHPIYQGLGLGEKLFDGARARLAELRLKGLLVWALTDNDQACGLSPPAASPWPRVRRASARSRCAKWPSPFPRLHRYLPDARARPNRPQPLPS